MDVRSASRRRPAGVRTVAVGAALALVATLMIGTGGAAPVAAAAKPKPGGEITYGLEAETGSGYCLPVSARLAISGIEVAAAVYDPLVVPNTKGEIVPYLAKSVAHDAAYTVWTVTLRDGITFHDGSPLNAEVVVANFQAMMKSALLGAALTNLASVAPKDAMTVTFTTKVPWVHFDGFLYLDGRAGIIGLAQLNSPDCPTKLIGTGPFMLAKPEDYTVNQQMVLVRNPRYWQKDANGTQLPYLDKITFKIVPESAQRVNGLKGGQLSVVHTDEGLPIQQIEGLSGQFNLMKQAAGRREVRYFLMNTSPGRPPLDDPNARLAVAMAIDRKQINEVSNGGEFDLADGPFDKDVKGYVKNPGFPKYNLKKAKQLVEAYKATHGGKFSVVIEHVNIPIDSEQAQILKEQLSKAGIDATLKEEDQTAFIISAVTQNFSILVWRNHPGDDPDGQYQWWNTGSLLNFGKINDPTLQSMLDQGRSEPDEAKRTPIYEGVNKRFASQVYNVWGWYVNWLIAAQKNVQGLAGPPLPDNGGKPLFIYGRHPLLGISLSK